jgi:miniconductance mechanosensitive channel
VLLFVFEALLSASDEIYRGKQVSKIRPIKGYIQVAKIVLFIFLGIVAIAVLMNRSPLLLLSGFGAMTAIILLLFKDSILGLVASIQLAGNDMVRLGDWIEMPKYGADGDVVDVSLTTVKVQNWDKTITTIPAYSLISDSFKNWRGMTESGGRRIKRALNLDMNSVRFCDPDMLVRLGKIQALQPYLEQKQRELKEFNEKHNIDPTSPVNGRNLTNIGTFRAYVVAYLKQHPKIRQDMTFLVRQLAPGPQGMPLEVYVFSNDQVWANYEAIQADIFDHLMAVVPEFGLRVFQYPTGADLQSLAPRQ